MRVRSSLVIVTAVAALWSAPAGAGIKVTFDESTRSADEQYRGVSVRKDLKAYLERLGARLDRGVDVSINVLHIDLAGWDPSTRGSPYGLRVFTPATWPKIRLRYVLTKNRKPIASGEDFVADHFYMALPSVTSSGDPLRYEKNMLNDWFRMRFASHLKSGG